MGYRGNKIIGLLLNFIFGKATGREMGIWENYLGKNYLGMRDQDFWENCGFEGCGCDLVESVRMENFPNIK